MTTYSGRAVYYNMTTGGYSFEDISILDDDANMWQFSPENFAPEARLHLGSGDVTLDLPCRGYSTSGSKMFLEAPATTPPAPSRWMRTTF